MEQRGKTLLQNASDDYRSGTQLPGLTDGGRGFISHDAPKLQSYADSDCMPENKWPHPGQPSQARLAICCKAAPVHIHMHLLTFIAGARVPYTSSAILARTGNTRDETSVHSSFWPRYVSVYVSSAKRRTFARRCCVHFKQIDELAPSRAHAHARDKCYRSVCPPVSSRPSSIFQILEMDEAI